MKEFVKSQKITYNLMSFTGFKALVMFSLLTDGPKSYEEICEYMLNHPYIKEKISIDTMRVYINSLKKIGCEIIRIKGEDKISRYVIISHPFELKFTPEQLQSVVKIYKSIIKDIELKDLLYLEKFLVKIGKYIKNEDFVSEIKNISTFKDVNRKILEDLSDCCEKKFQLIITYNSPTSGEKDIEIIADKLEIANNKIYLHGFGFEYMQYGSFLVNRIKNIKEIKLNKTKPTLNLQQKIIYELKCDPSKHIIDSNEKILKTENDKLTIEITTTNNFYVKQKLLEYGPLCKVLQPVDFQKEFIQLLKEMKAGCCYD